MIMSAIFIETFFSTSGACARAGMKNDSNSIEPIRNFLLVGIFFSRERSRP